MRRATLIALLLSSLSWSTASVFSSKLPWPPVCLDGFAACPDPISQTY